MISMIAAMSQNRVIGKKNNLPWHMPIDLKHFNSLTKDHYIIMGRKTFESIGAKPLPSRHTVVVSKNKNFKAEGCFTATSLEEAITIAKSQTKDEIFITGGSQLYIEGLDIADKIYLTTINTHIADGDAFFPEIDLKIWKKKTLIHHPADEKNTYSCDIDVFQRKI